MNTAREKMQARLQALVTEFEAGQKMLAELETKQAALRPTLLRISGAIQVLEELLGEGTAAGDGGTPLPEAPAATG